MFKYLLWFLSLATLVIFYFFNTSSGHDSLGKLLGKYLTSKSHNKIEVKSFNIDSYPYITMQLRVNNAQTIFLEGEAEDEHLDLNYRMVGKTFSYNSIHFDDDFRLRGKIKGTRGKPYITGRGKLFDGLTRFSFTKKAQRFEDMNISFEGADSKKILSFFHYKAFIEGDMNISAYFKYFSTFKRDGEAEILVNQGYIPAFSKDVPLKLKTKIKFLDAKYTYDIALKSDTGLVLITEGSYHKGTKKAEATYVLELKELASFQQFLKHKYKGAFSSSGTITYDDSFVITGTSKELGGLAKYRYAKNNLNIYLEGVSLFKMLNMFSYPTLLNSDVYGKIEYDIKEKIIFIDTQLKKTQFRRSPITDRIFEATGIDIRKDVYDQSSFIGGYQNSILNSILKIDNGKKHIYLTGTRMNSTRNTIESDFEAKLHGETVSGEIYGSLKNPQVSIDVRKFLKDKLNEKVGSWLGTDRKKELRQELSDAKQKVSKKLEEIDIDEVKKKAKHFLDGFL